MQIYSPFRAEFWDYFEKNFKNIDVAFEDDFMKTSQNILSKLTSKIG